MKRFLLMLVSLFFFLISCNQSSKSSKKTENISNGGQVDNIFYYVKFINLDNTIESESTIQEVKNKIFSNGYAFNINKAKGNIGVVDIDSTHHFIPQDLSEFKQSIHRFRDFSEYNSESGVDVEKIVITLNKSKNNTVSYNHRTYQKLGHKDWQSRTNAGNFKKPNETTLANSMISTIVGLTFK